MNKTSIFSHIPKPLARVMIRVMIILILIIFPGCTISSKNTSATNEKNINQPTETTQPAVTNQPAATNSAPKIAENESPRAQQDRFFYNVGYFSDVNAIRLEFTITANDAVRKINGLSFDLNGQEPPLPTPTTSSVSVNGGGIDNSWDCRLTDTTFSCNGKAALEINQKSDFTFAFAELKKYPEKLTINLLENESVVTTITPLLQSQ